MNKKALYPGSFDPFTNGHLDIVRKASALFDEVYVLIGINSSKKRAFNADKMKTAIEKTAENIGCNNVKVIVYDGLIAVFAKENHIKYMIRGLRNNMDYNYEENIAEVNKLIDPEMEYVYFRAENVAVSSSMVKELYMYEQDVSPFVPDAVYEIISGGC
ncbi:MAG: pantetheine-phosphate adenylyltransferase [Clostridia bacterium]|nr:pantetheine-phosphate adenylyltransferase [Clostridia bacterium]